MNDNSDFHHISVLQSETIEQIMPSERLLEKLKTDGAPCVIVDCTLGGAGHSALALDELLKQGLGTPEQPLWLIGIDQDPVAIEVSKKRMAERQAQLPGLQFFALRGNFSELSELLSSVPGFTKAHGIFADFGVSSPQLDTPERGFSLQKSGPLDMRMNPDASITALDLLTKLGEAELAKIFFEFGEEPKSRLLAKAIVQDRNAGKLPLENTLDFADYVRRVLHYHKSRVHPATRIFQALRIAVNGELDAISKLLFQIPDLVVQGGKAGFISFHSLEDRLVKRTLRAWEKGSRDLNYDAQNLPSFVIPPPGWGKETPRGGTTATENEAHQNPRARSARLRTFIFSQVFAAK